jgi:hypothetical protein
MTLCAKMVAALIGASIATAGGAALAQEALYGKQPPRGSAFVRLVNATPAAAAITTDFQGEVHLGTAAADRVAPYTVVEKAADHPLTITVKEGGHEGHLTYKAPADGYVTIVVDQDPAGLVTLTPIVDQAEFNQTRARLAFYNAAPACASATLAVDPGGPAVFDGVAPATTKSRTVNPVQATVRANCAGKPGPTLALGGMQLGASYSIWLIQPGSEAVLFLTPDVSAKYKPKS